MARRISGLLQLSQKIVHCTKIAIDVVASSAHKGCMLQCSKTNMPFVG